MLRVQFVDKSTHRERWRPRLRSNQTFIASALRSTASTSLLSRRVERGESLSIELQERIWPALYTEVQYVGPKLKLHGDFFLKKLLVAERSLEIQRSGQAENICAPLAPTATMRQRRGAA